MADVTETARAHVQRLAENWNWPDPSILENIVALGEEAIPAIQELLTPELLADAEFDDQADGTVYYALELLSALGTPAAIPVFVNAYRQVDDDMVEGLESALQRLGPEAIGPLLSVAADAGLTWYARALAANGAKHEVKQDPARREQVGAALQAVLIGYLQQPEPLTDEEKDVVATFITDLSELAYEPARPVIEAAFDADRVQSALTGPWDIPIIDRAGVAELYGEGGRSDDREPPPFLDTYRRRRQEHQEEQAKKAHLSLLHPPAPPQPALLGRKLGRNDPCWCGSGQKYKKCHLAQDEKERVRL